MKTNIIDQFARVNGSGLFFLDDFCALTGCPPQQAAGLLSQDPRVELLGTGLYLLKPQPKPRRAPRYDWAFKPDVQKAIFSACDAQPLPKSELMHLTGLALTTLDRYLCAMERTGNLTSRRRGMFKYYSAKRFKPLTTYYRELPPHSLASSPTLESSEQSEHGLQDSLHSQHLTTFTTSFRARPGIHSIPQENNHAKTRI